MIMIDDDNHEKHTPTFTVLFFFSFLFALILFVLPLSSSAFRTLLSLLMFASLFAFSLLVISIIISDFCLLFEFFFEERTHIHLYSSGSSRFENFCLTHGSTRFLKNKNSSSFLHLLARVCHSNRET